MLGIEGNFLNLIKVSPKYLFTLKAFPVGFRAKQRCPLLLLQFNSVLQVQAGSVRQEKGEKRIRDKARKNKSVIICNVITVSV